MKKIVITILLVVSMSFCYSQRNSVYAEFSTHIVSNSLSLNYERMLFRDLDLYVRVGFGFYKDIQILGTSEDYFSIPISLNYLLKLSSKNFIDLGIGPNIIESGFDSPNAPKTITYLFTNIGYRQQIGEKLFWRAHITPYAINLTDRTYSYGDENFLIVEEFDFPRTWVGFSLGLRF